MRFLIFLITIVFLYKLFKHFKIIENFDNNCIKTVTPNYTLTLSDIIYKYTNNNPIVDSNGNVVLKNNFWNDVSDNFRLDMSDNAVSQFNEILMNPFDPNFSHFDKQNCKLSYTF